MVVPLVQGRRVLPIYGHARRHRSSAQDTLF